MLLPNFVNTSQKALEKQKLHFPRIALFHVKTRVSLNYFVNDCGLAWQAALKKTKVKLNLLTDIDRRNMSLSLYIYLQH